MEDKRKWTKDVESLLKTDNRAEIVSIDYARNDPGQHVPEEVVRIRYKGGAVADINVTFNSLGAILKEIVKEVYDQNATGTFFRGFLDEEVAE